MKPTKREEQALDAWFYGMTPEQWIEVWLFTPEECLKRVDELVALAAVEGPRWEAVGRYVAERHKEDLREDAEERCRMWLGRAAHRLMDTYACGSPWGIARLPEAKEES